MTGTFGKVHFELTSVSPMIHHKDDVEGADELEVWRNDPENANVSRRGDDRSPPWTWFSYLYHDGQHVTLPFENLMSCLLAAGARKVLKGRKTFKELTQSGLSPNDDHFRFLARGKEVPVAPLYELSRHPFGGQGAAVRPYHFHLFVKRAPVGKGKHVRVRPRFPDWSVSGSLSVMREELTHAVIGEIFAIAGNLGLGDWRPSSPRRPGPYGKFTAKLRWS